MIRLGSHFTLLLALCLAVAARPATSGMVAEHEASFKHTRRFHRARINKPRYDDGYHPGYPTATYDEGHFDLTYPTAPHSDEQYATPSPSPSATQGSASSIYAADGRYHPDYLNATYDNVQVHAEPTTYNNEKHPPQTADQASPSSNSPAAVKTLVVAVAELPTLSTLSATSSPTTTSTSAKPDVPAPTTTTTSAEGAPTGIQKLLAPAATPAATASTNPLTLTTALSGAVGFAEILASSATSIVSLVVQPSTTSTTSGGTAVATTTLATPGTAPTAASIAGGVNRPQDDDPMYHVGRSRQKRADDGQYLPDPEFEDSQYHPNGKNGEHSLRKGNQKLSDDDRYHPSSTYDGHSGKRNNRRVPVA